MQRTIKGTSVFLLITVFLISCGPVTPWPVETITPTRTRPAKNSSIQDATAATPLAPTPASELPAKNEEPKPSTYLWENLPPSQLVDQYQLTPWTPAFTGTMNDLLNRVNDEFYPYIYSQSDDFRAAFASEAWLRTGSKMENGPWLCDVNYYNPEAGQFPGLRPGQDLYSYFMEDLINNRGVAVENLPDATSELIGTSDCLGGFSLSTSGNLWFTPATVQNLFGDGQVSFVFPVGSIFYSDSRVAFYATHVVGDRVQVEGVKEWEKYVPFASSYDFKIVDVGDQNHNGRNEFAIQVDFGTSGFPTGESEWLNLYEWDPETASFLASDQITVFSQQCSHGACFGDWQLTPAGSGSFGVVTHEYYNTGLSKCEFVAREKEYKLDFEGLALLSDRYLSPDVKTPACQVFWAYEVLMEPDGWKNDQAIGVVENALSDWPAELDEVFGKEGRNYIQLKLGLWHDLRGESKQAFDIINHLKDQQIDPTLTFIAQLAQAYTETRPQDGMVAACFRMNNLQSQLLSDTDGEESGTMMGFWDPRWINSAGDICDDTAAISSLFSTSTSPVILDEESLKSWLADQGMEEIHIDKVELGDQGIWLTSFLANTNQRHNVGYYQLWSFADLPAGRSAIFLNEMWQDNTWPDNADRYAENSVTTQIFEPENSKPILLVEFDACLVFLREANGGLKLLEQICDIDLAFSSDGQQVNVMKRGWTPNVWEFTSYTWDKSTNSIQELPSHKYDFDAVERQAGSFIYKENDYMGAIVYINNALAQSPPDRVMWPDCYDYIAERAEEIEAQPHITLCDQPMDWHRPYLLYLLGLAYEKSGRQEDARNTYYALWQQYPKNVFGVAASLRLEPVNP